MPPVQDPTPSSAVRPRHTSTDHWPAPGSSLAICLSTVPPLQRERVHTWLKWWHETARIPLDILDIGVAETKLAWWVNALNEAAQQGQAQHPILQTLLSSSAPGDLPPWPMWLTQLQAQLDYLHQNRWMDEAALSHHLATTTGEAAACVAWLLGVHDEAGLAAARAWGIGIRRCHQLARLGQDARAGWVHVPIDTLQRFDVKAHQLVKPQAGQLPDGWPALLAHQHGLAREAINAARAATRALDSHTRQRLRPIAALGAIMATQADAVAQAGGTVLFERLRLTPLRKAWAAQRQAWRLWFGA